MNPVLETLTKPWYLSRTIWGGVIAILSAILGYFGYQIAPEDQEFLIAGLMGLASFVGGAVAVIGRVKASRQIGPTNKERGFAHSYFLWFLCFYLCWALLIGYAIGITGALIQPAWS